MKSIEDHLKEALEGGSAEVITATELRQNIGACLTLASMGKHYCIKRKGRIVAWLVPEGLDVPHVIEPDGTCETMALGDLAARLRAVR